MEVVIKTEKIWRDRQFKLTWVSCLEMRWLVKVSLIRPWHQICLLFKVSSICVKRLSSFLALKHKYLFRTRTMKFLVIESQWIILGLDLFQKWSTNYIGCAGAKVNPRWVAHLAKTAPTTTKKALWKQRSFILCSRYRVVCLHLITRWGR